VTETPEQTIARLQRELDSAKIAKLQRELSEVRAPTDPAGTDISNYLSGLLPGLASTEKPQEPVDTRLAPAPRRVPRNALPNWLHFYNYHRAHSAIGALPPISRLTNLAGHHS
jgi:transposase InsO family protein